MSEYKNSAKKVILKPGRTIIVRSNDLFSVENLNGLLQNNNVHDGKYFLVFDTIDNAKNAFKLFKNDSKLSVRYAYYRIFFTMDGIDQKTDYSIIKRLHMNWITEKSLGQVLYYKQYMKDNKYLGCGDFTVDTKESMDKLLNKDEFKTYSFDGLSGTYYRYNKKVDSEKSLANDLESSLVA